MRYPNAFVDIEIEVTSTNDATIAVGNIHLSDDTTIQFSGTAKKDPLDKNDGIIGERLAVGRALQSLSKRMLRQGKGMVKCVEDNRIASSEAVKKINPHLAAAARVAEEIVDLSKFGTAVIGQR